MVQKETISWHDNQGLKNGKNMEKCLPQMDNTRYTVNGQQPEL